MSSHRLPHSSTACLPRIVSHTEKKRSVSSSGGPAAVELSQSRQRCRVRRVRVAWRACTVKATFSEPPYS
eukprot:2785393-Pleurochrysis_carterae.AAC.1